MIMLGVGCGPQVGPFPSRPIMGSIRGEGTPPQTLAVIWRKKGVPSLSSGCSRKIKEDQGRRPTAASAAATTAAQPRAAAMPAAETVASPCFGHVQPTQSTLRRRCRKAAPPPLLLPSFPTYISPQSAPPEISRPISPRPTFHALTSHPSHDPMPVQNVPSFLNSHSYVFYLPSTPSHRSFLSMDPPLPRLTFHFPKSHPHTASILSPLLPSYYPTLHLPLLPLPSGLRPTAWTDTAADPRSTPSTFPHPPNQTPFLRPPDIALSSIFRPRLPPASPRLHPPRLIVIPPSVLSSLPEDSPPSAIITNSTPEFAHLRIRCFQPIFRKHHPLSIFRTAGDTLPEPPTFERHLGTIAPIARAADSQTSLTACRPRRTHVPQLLPYLKKNLADPSRRWTRFIHFNSTRLTRLPVARTCCPTHHQVNSCGRPGSRLPARGITLLGVDHAPLLIGHPWSLTFWTPVTSPAQPVRGPLALATPVREWIIPSRHHHRHRRLDSPLCRPPVLRTKGLHHHDRPGSRPAG